MDCSEMGFPMVFSGFSYSNGEKMAKKSVQPISKQVRLQTCTVPEADPSLDMENMPVEWPF